MKKSKTEEQQEEFLCIIFLVFFVSFVVLFVTSQ